MGNPKTERNKRRKRRRKLEAKGIDWRYREALERRLASKIETCSCN
jgi:hypothetical protein